MFKHFLAVPTFLLLVLFVLPSVALDTSFVCNLNFLATCCWSSTSHIILSNPSSLRSSKPNSSGLLSGTTKNLYLMTLCFKWTKQTPNCSIFKLLHIFKNYWVILVVHSNSIVAFGNTLLDILNGMRLPSVPETCYKLFWSAFHLYQILT